MKKGNKICNIILLLKMVWEIAPGKLLLSTGIALTSSLIWVFNTVYFMRYILDTHKNREFYEIMCFVWMVVVVNLAYQIVLTWYNNIYVPVTDIKVKYSLNLKIFQKVLGVDISCYENPQFYNKYVRAGSVAASKAIDLLKHNILIITSSLSSVYVIYVMYTITPWSLLFVTFPLLGSLLFGRKFSEIVYKVDKKCIIYKRKQDYVSRIIYLPQYIGDLRLTKMWDILGNIYQEATEKIITLNKNYAFDKIKVQIPMLMLQFPITFQGLWFVGAYLAIHKRSITLEEFVVLSSSIVSVTWMIKNFTLSLEEIISNANFVGDFFELFLYKPLIDEFQKGIVVSHINKIEFRNVYFKYGGKENYVLENINFTIYEGAKVALVGLNGSGKSTLIKLLLRLYDPDKGEILLNDINIKLYDIKAYRKMIGVLFQDFSVFSQSILENILMSDKCDLCNRRKAMLAAKKSGLIENIMSKTKDFDTILTKEFMPDGIELSGGEKQKLAISRVIATEAPVMVFDEPSSSLDPISANEMYKNILGLLTEQKKIGIIISHNLSMALSCDKILVFKNGQIIEHGSHDELMCLNKLYAKMYRTQAENYKH